MDKRRKMIEALKDAVEWAERDDHIVRMSTEAAGQLIEMLLGGDEWRSIADDPPPEPNEHEVATHWLAGDGVQRYTTSDPILVLTEKGVYRAEACGGNIDIDTLARDPGQPTHWMPMPGASGSGYADRVAAQAPPLREDDAACSVAAQVYVRFGKADRKKVIRGLTCCQTINEYCDECPYNRISYDQCTKVLIKEALELLKEQPEKHNKSS